MRIWWDRGVAFLRYALGLLIPAAYVFAVEADILCKGFSFLQPLVVGTMPIFLQFVLLDILFFFAVREHERKIAALFFIAALFLCDFAVRGGWLVVEAVIIAAVASVITRDMAHIILPVRALLLIIVFSLS